MTERPRSRGAQILHGVLGGLVAGLVFALADMVVARWLGGPAHAPLLIPAALADPAIVATGYLPVQNALVGAVVHATFSAAYGVVFALLLQWGRGIAAPGSLLVLLGLLYAMVLWVVNFLVMAPIVFPTLGALAPEMGSVGPVLAAFSFCHAFYGLTLGTYMAAVRPGVRAAAR